MPPLATQSSLLTGQWDFNKGLVNARADSDLVSGELTIAHGVLYKRGSEEVFMKTGRTAYSAEQLGLPGVGLFYAEFSNPLATNRILARAGTSLFSGPAALTGTFGTAVTTGLNAAPLGFWGTYTNQRYYLQDGASTMQVEEFRTDRVTAGEFIHRAAGLLPTTDAPIVTVQAAGASTVALTSATTTRSGDKNFANPAKFVDGDKTTSSDVFLGGDAGQNGRITASAFTGTGSGVRTNWIISVTYGSTVNNDAVGNVVVQYSLNNGSSFTTAETTTTPQTKHEVTIPLFGISQDSSLIRVRVTGTKTTNRGTMGVQAFDTRVYAADSSATGNTLTTGVRYWVTEYADRFGIESGAFDPPNVSDVTGAVTNIAGFQVSLPQQPQNTAMTHFVVYRTVDGGAFPTGTQVARISVRDTDPASPTFGQFTPKPYFFDPGPLNLAASTNTFGFFQVAGLFFIRDVIPPIGTSIATYQNALVTAPLDFPNTVRYSAAGFPESWPTLNTVALGSDRDDTVMGLAPLGVNLGIFMRGRCKRLDHLPTPSDPTFSSAPEDFAPDHGLASRNGLTYITPPGGTSTHIAYVAKDGVRLTNLYQSIVITNNIDWRGTVDTTQLSTSILRALPSESRLEFYFTPTAAFLTIQGWPVAAKCCMFIHYQIHEEFDIAKVRITVQPINAAAVVTVPVAEQDYSFILSSGVNVAPSVVYVDEVGTSDALKTIDTSGTIPRKLQTGVIYQDGEGSKLVRWRINRATLDRGAGTDTITYSLTGFRFDRGLSWTKSLDYLNTFGGAKPLNFNVSGQAHRFAVTVNSSSGSPPNVRNIGWVAELQGEFL